MRVVTAAVLTMTLSGLISACATTNSTLSDPQYLQKRWALVALNGEALSETQQAKQPYIQMQSQFASAYAGCNRLSAPYQAEGDSIQFGAIMQTKMACLNNMKFEQRFIDMLAYSERWTINGDYLRFYADNPEQAIAVFKAQ